MAICVKIFAFSRKKNSSRFISSLETSQVCEVSCLDPGGAKARLAAASNVESRDIFWNTDAFIKIKLCQKSHEIVSFHDILQSK